MLGQSHVSRNLPLLRARVARFAILIVTLVTIGTGLNLLLARTVVLWEPVDESDYTWEANPIDVTGIGLALLCTGILCAVLLLACEGYVWRRDEAIEPVRHIDDELPTADDSA